MCIDPLALPDLAPPRAGADRARRSIKVMHAARQDLGVLLPAVGLVQPVFDTQIAAALAGFPAQVGYARAGATPALAWNWTRRTRADWSRRPLSAEQQEYALDDVRHLLGAARKLAGHARPPKAASPGWRKNSRRSPIADALRVEPDDAWKKVKGLPALDEAASTARAGRRRVARAARHRAQPAARLDPRRRRACVKSCCACRVPLEALSSLPEMPESVVRKCGEELLALVRDAGYRRSAAAVAAARTPGSGAARHGQAPRRHRQPRLRLSSRSAPEVLATRRELEDSPPAASDVSLLRGWRAGSGRKEAAQRFDLRRTRRALRATLRTDSSRGLAQPCERAAPRRAAVFLRAAWLAARAACAQWLSWPRGAAWRVRASRWPWSMVLSRPARPAPAPRAGDCVISSGAPSAPTVRNSPLSE